MLLLLAGYAFDAWLKTSELSAVSAFAAYYDKFYEFIIDYFRVHDFVDLFCFIFRRYYGSAFRAGEDARR